MLKFYLKIQNKMITKNILSIVVVIVLIFNIGFRIVGSNFIKLPYIPGKFDSIQMHLIPEILFEYCDVYLLMLFIILMFFFIGTDFKNSMEEITLASGGMRCNKFILLKLISLSAVYFPLYIITFINIYTIYIQKLHGIKNCNLIPLREIIFISAATNIFIISLSLFILFLSRDIAVSTIIITAYYLIEESLWRCKVTQKFGILGHIYEYNDYSTGQLFKIKIIYIICGLLLLFFTYIISQRKRSIIIHK